MNRQVEELSFKFEGDDQIDVETLATVLDNTLHMFKKTSARIIDNENGFRKFYVKEVKKRKFYC